MDKEKVINYLKEQIEYCKVVNNHSDQAMIWAYERMLVRIKSGLFDK